MSNGVSPAVTSFLRDHVGSIELLEVLLLFHREPSRPWSAQTAAAELRIQPRSAEGRCAALLMLGLLKAKDETLVFNTASPLSKVVEELADTYRTRRVTVIELIFSKPIETTRLFADAFVIRKGGASDG